MHMAHSIYSTVVKETEFFCGSLSDCLCSLTAQALMATVNPMLCLSKCSLKLCNIKLAQFKCLKALGRRHSACFLLPNLHRAHHYALPATVTVTVSLAAFCAKVIVVLVRCLRLCVIVFKIYAKT